ncbi:RNase P subunit p30 family protein [Halococcus thailandensis]|uniref:Ribonuclease P protein component 3 n=1 Tax=Halococcus thailandensis JCM 13552 TaxID=1227457 RepID=M0MXL3_9EURY|nr:RNase P subunit p30 family protein [Halococcus thailandensis]EMA50346.1 ribonuclease P protein component 3 [Halococcus thailandensis JCM 13552]
MDAYEAVRAYPDGESTAARLALTAAECDFSGIVVRNGPAAFEGGPSRSEVAGEYDIDVVDAVEIGGESRSAASARVKEHREEHTLVVVEGSDALNRFACEEPRVDVLARPMADGDVNHVLARAAKRNGVRFEFDFGRVLRTSGGQRVQALGDLRKLREIVTYYDAPYVVSASPESHLELRAPRELLALGDVVGFDREAVAQGLAEWGRLAARNRERLSESFIGPGVRRGRHEEDD